MTGTATGRPGAVRPAGLAAALAKMASAGVSEAARRTFEGSYLRLAAGETGMLPEADLEPCRSEPLDLAGVTEADAARAASRTVVVKLNGGLGTSMGMDRAKSLLPAKDGRSFLDVIVAQVLHVRQTYRVDLPLLLMNSFRTRADSLAALGRHPGVSGPLPPDFVQTKVPKLLAEDLSPVRWEPDAELEWCPPGHGDIYGVLHSTGLVGRMLELGYSQLFVSNADNLGASPDPRVAAWFARRGVPFAIEAVRRTPSDRKGGHFAIRRSDGRLVLRETAQTLPEDRVALADLDRHRYASTNNIWIDLRALAAVLDRTGGNLGLPFIRNEKTVDPRDPDSPRVVQLETAMGAAIEVFEDAVTVEVPRSRFVPVKTTDDLLVLRSDCYRLAEDATLTQVCPAVPFVELAPTYRFVGAFEERFPAGPPSLREAAALRVRGDWTFGAGVRVVGDVTLGPEGGVVPDGAVL